MHIENEFPRIDGLHKTFEFAIVRVGRVGHFEVERQILVVLIVPASHDNEDCGLFSVALVDAADKKIKLVIFKFLPIDFWSVNKEHCFTYSWALRSRMDLI